MMAVGPSRPPQGVPAPLKGIFSAPDRKKDGMRDLSSSGAYFGDGFTLVGSPTPAAYGGTPFQKGAKEKRGHDCSCPLSGLFGYSAQSSNWCEVMMYAESSVY